MRDKPVLTRRVVERIAENRIRSAIEEGRFDNLPGAGKPFSWIDEPYDPLWWAKSWIRRERLQKVLTGAVWEETRRRRG